MATKGEMARWNEEAEAVQASWNGPVEGTPYERRESAHKRMVYGLLRSYMTPRKRKTLKQCVRNEASSAPQSPSFEENPFHWGLIAFDPDGEWLSGRQERHRWAWNMLYAHQHNVPADLYIGFIYQAGGPDLVTEKARSHKREPWFRGDVAAVPEPPEPPEPSP